MTAIDGFNFLSSVNTTYTGAFFVTLKDWGKRTAPEEKYGAIMKHVNDAFSKIPGAVAFAFSPPAIPGIGASGGVTFILQDRSGKELTFLSENVKKFMAACKERPELAGVSTTFAPGVPQVLMKVDRDKVLKQNLDLGAVYQTLQTFMGGNFVNYFNRFGRQWQVFVQAQAICRSLAGIVAGVLVGVFLDTLTTFVGADTAYRLMPVWQLFFWVIVLVFLTKLYRSWKRYGGDESYEAPVLTGKPVAEITGTCQSVKLLCQPKRNPPRSQSRNLRKLP